MMSLPELVVTVLTAVGFSGALVFVLVFWGKLKFPKNLRRQEVGKTSSGCVVYLLHHKDTLQTVTMPTVLAVVDRIIANWEAIRLDPGNRDPALAWSARTLDEVVIYLASYSEFDKENGPWLDADHTAACVVRTGKWFGKSIPCILVRDGLFDPKTGEPVAHEMCHVLLQEAGAGYDRGHTKPWVWTAHGKHGSLQGR